MTTVARAVAFAVCLLPCACGAPAEPPPPTQRVDTPVRGTFAEADRKQPDAPAAKDAGRVADDWLATFGDARLSALVDEAQRNNPDLAAAVARRDRALAQAGFADSAFSPKVDAALGPVIHGGRQHLIASGRKSLSQFADMGVDAKDLHDQNDATTRRALWHHMPGVEPVSVGGGKLDHLGHGRQLPVRRYQVAFGRRRHMPLPCMVRTISPCWFVTS